MAASFYVKNNRNQPIYDQKTIGHFKLSIRILIENLKWEYNMVEYLIRNGFDEKILILIVEVVTSSEG